MQELHGAILRGYSGFYYVLAKGREWECHLRGKHKIHNKDFLPGDKVIIAADETGKGTIEEVLPRRNQLTRPPVANVDQMVVVVSLAEPVADLALLDRLLILAEAERIQALIVLNKLDLVTNEEYERIAELYRPVYQVVVTSAKLLIGVELLRRHLTERTSAFAGPSGVGKSSLLNAIQPGLRLKTGEVSRKSGRGKHTTRHVNLLPLEVGGMVVDTPGFSRLTLPEVSSQELWTLFPEFTGEISECKFRNCLHDQEPGCGIKDAVENGEISSKRYERYLQFLQELKHKELKY